MADKTIDIKIKSVADLRALRETEKRLREQIVAAQAAGNAYDDLEKQLAAVQASLSSVPRRTKIINEILAGAERIPVVGDAMRALNGNLLKVTASLGAMGIAFKAVSASVTTFRAVIAEGIAYNKQLETQATKFETLLGSASAARARIAELADFAASTPFQLEDIAAASATLQTLTKGALATGDGLRKVGDAAALAGVPIADMATTIGRAYSALTNNRAAGESLQRLQEIGVLSGEARNEIEALSAAAKGTQAWDALSAALGIADGQMSKQSATLDGLISTFDDLKASLSGIASEGVFERITDGLARVNAALSTFEARAGARAIDLGLTTAIDRLQSLAAAAQQFNDKFKTFVPTARLAAEIADKLGAGISKTFETAKITQARSEIEAITTAFAEQVTAVSTMEQREAALAAAQAARAKIIALQNNLTLEQRSQNNLLIDAFNAQVDLLESMTGPADFLAQAAAEQADSTSDAAAAAQKLADAQRDARSSIQRSLSELPQQIAVNQLILAGRQDEADALEKSLEIQKEARRIAGDDYQLRQDALALLEMLAEQEQAIADAREAAKDAAKDTTTLSSKTPTSGGTSTGGQSDSAPVTLSALQTIADGLAQEADDRLTLSDRLTAAYDDETVTTKDLKTTIADLTAAYQSALDVAKDTAAQNGYFTDAGRDARDQVATLTAAIKALGDAAFRVGNRFVKADQTPATPTTPGAIPSATPGTAAQTPTSGGAADTADSAKTAENIDAAAKALDKIATAAAALATAAATATTAADKTATALQTADTSYQTLATTATSAATSITTATSAAIDNLISTVEGFAATLTSKVSTLSSKISTLQRQLAR